MQTIRRQQGITVIGILLMMVLVGFAALVALRVVPLYLEGYKVRSIVQSLEKDRSLSASNRTAVISTLMKRLEIDDVRQVKRENIALEQVSNGLAVTVEYDARTQVIGNLDAIAHFQQKAVITH